MNNEQLEEFRKKIMLGGGEAAIEKQHASGKLTARERIDALLDKGSFEELDQFAVHQEHNFGMEGKELPGDGVVTGTGTINGRPVGIFAQDFTVMGGSLGLTHARKITKMMDLAVKLGMPIIGINDSGGARIQAGVDSQAGYGEIFMRNALYSGVVPQLSIILGPCAGGAAYSPALTDLVFVVEGISKMFVTGPNVIKTVLGEEISQEDLGGAKTLAGISGNAHFYAADEQACFEQIRQLLSFLPQNNQDQPAASAPKEPNKLAKAIGSIIPNDSKRPYDVRDIIRAISDDSEFCEVHEMWAKNIVVGFGRIDGRSVGFVANQPLYLAGVLDCDASNKASRFVMLCDTYNIPIVTLEDMPGCLPGAEQEHAGVIRNGAKMLYAYSVATVPKITVILRKAYGGGYVAMNSKHLGADLVYSWPNAEIAVMGPEAAAKIIFKKDIAEAADQKAMLAEKVKEYAETVANPLVAAGKGYVDAIIAPEQTREVLKRALKLCASKHEDRPKKKHGLPPA